MAEKVRRVQFAVPSEYERQRAEAERRRLMAEMLAQQEYDPGQFPGAPIPKAAPLVQGLQSFLKAYSVRKAKEAEEKMRAEDIKGVETLFNQLGPQERSGAEAAVAEMAQTAQPGRIGADGTYTPSAIMPGTAEIGLPYTEAAPTGQARRQILASAGTPRAAQLAQLLMSQEPETKTMEFGGQLVNVSGGQATPVMMNGQPLTAQQQPKAPTTVGGMMWDEQQGKFVGIPGYEEQQGRIAAARRPEVVVNPDRERLVSIIGPDGKPKYVRESEAVGQIPFTARSAADIAAEDAKLEKNRIASIDTDYALKGLAELINHPGRKPATGASYKLGSIPGTDARGFVAKLDTFKSQTFIPMVKALVGMGALSNAEGQKLTDAVGALNVEMKEEEFLKEMTRVGNYLYDKAKAAGLEVELPEQFGVRNKPSRSNW